MMAGHRHDPDRIDRTPRHASEPGHQGPHVHAHPHPAVPRERAHVHQRPTTQPMPRPASKPHALPVPLPARETVPQPVQLPPPGPHPLSPLDSQPTSPPTSQSLPPAGPPPVPQPPVPAGTSRFWYALNSIEQQALAAASTEMLYPAGQVLWYEGQPAEHVLVIRAGWVKICVQRAGFQKIIAMRGPGDLIGERAVLSLCMRSATVVALDDVYALSLPAENFTTVLDAHQRLFTIMEGQLYERLTEDPGCTHASTQPTYEAPQGPYGVMQSVQHAMPRASQGGGAQTLTPPGEGRAAIPHDGAQAPFEQSPYASRAQALLPLRHAYATEPHGPPSHAPYVASAMPYVDTAQPVRPSSPAPGRHSWAGQMCSILFTDIAGFGGLHRNDDDRLIVRRVMYGLLRAALEGSGVWWAECYREDRGDGALIVVPPGMPTRSVVDPMLALLTAGLRLHNHHAGPAVRFQLRAALHVGPVTPDDEGVSGSAIIHTARLLEAPIFKDWLAITQADLGFIASSFVYETVIAQAPGHVNPAGYQPVNCKVKESDLTGWMHLSEATT